MAETLFDRRSILTVVGLFIVLAILRTVFRLSIFTIIGLVIVFAVLRTVIRYRRRHRPFTKYHKVGIILLLIGVTAAFGTVLAFESVDREAHGIEYSVDAEQPPEEQSADTRETQEIRTEPYGSKTGGPYEFEDLSPDAQDVFLSTLRGDGSYFTRTSPPWQFQGHAGYEPGYAFVHYDSTWYKITVDSGGSRTAEVLDMLVYGVITVTTLIVGWLIIWLASKRSANSTH